MSTDFTRCTAWDNEVLDRIYGHVWRLECCIDCSRIHTVQPARQIQIMDELLGILMRLGYEVLFGKHTDDLF